MIIPRQEELNDWGRLDASNESAVTVARGVQHKYVDTVLLLCNEVCGAYCRYCFRKRLFMDDNDEVTNDVSAGLAYIAEHPEVTNVLLTGGDPLLMSTRRLVEIFEALRGIEHVRIIRLGSKMPAFDPWRVRRDEELQAAFRKVLDPGEAHLPDGALRSPARADRRRNRRHRRLPPQRGHLREPVSDDPGHQRRPGRARRDVLDALLHRLPPVTTCSRDGRRRGTSPTRVPIVRGWHIFQEALRRGSGLARRAKYCMSHETGKVEVVGVDDERIYLRYHQAKNPDDLSRFFVRRRDDDAYWLDQLEPVEAELAYAD